MDHYGRQQPYGDGGMQIQPYHGGPRTGDFRSYSASYATATENNIYDIKKEKSIERSKSWGITDPELLRKKRVASYKMYSVEGKVKGSFRKSFRWLKQRYTQSEEELLVGAVREKDRIMWESICLTLAATAGNNIGKVLQKKGTIILPPLSLKLKVIRAYAGNKPWALGFLMDIFGALLMLRALSLAPVSVVQPVSGCGLAILSVFSHFYLKEVMNVFDWIGITMAGIGTIGVGAGGEEQVASLISVFQLLWLALVVAFLFVGTFHLWYFISKCFSFHIISVDLYVLLNAWLHIYKRQRREQELMEYEVVEEIIYGLESGVLFGMASVVSKMGFVFVEQGFSAMFIPMCISISICCSGTGFFYQTRGLKHGRAIVVSTCAAVASIVTGVVAGMFALGEKLPTSPSGRLLLLLGWLLIMLGVVLLVTSSRLIRHLPRSFRRSRQTSLERGFSTRRTASHVQKDTNPSAVIQAATLHHLLTTPSKEKD
ncbi:hypothetical protein HID58_004251 [Brassica napus]|uniref:Probable magnesium transporter n=1 Tax=Brassica napus TaxID=3708 RepID=A0ABQ8E808_BRANA|nr:hypothetical protein HID58_004251 [Brassica napus]